MCGNFSGQKIIFQETDMSLRATVSRKLDGKRTYTPFARGDPRCIKTLCLVAESNRRDVRSNTPRPCSRLEYAQSGELGQPVDGKLTVLTLGEKSVFLSTPITWSSPNDTFDR